MATRIPQAAAIALLLCTAAGAAVAQEYTGWAVSAGVGSSQIRDEDGNDRFDGNAFGFYIDVEYRFTPNVALGIGGFNLGTAEDDFGGVDTEIDVKGWAIFGRVILPLTESVDLYGRIGAATYHADLEPGGSSSPFGEDALDLGVGLDIGTGDAFALRLEGRYFDGTRDESGGLLTLGMSYRF